MRTILSVTARIPLFYYFGLSFAGLSALIDIDEDKEIIFGDELTIDHIIWMGIQPTLHEKLLPWAFPKPVLCRHCRLSAQGCTEGTDHPLFALIVPSIN